MTEDMKDLEFLDKHEVLMRLATRLEKTRSQAELVRIIADLVKRKPEVMKNAPPEVDTALGELSGLEDHMLELRSIIHWLTKRRD
jgi:hypothetical protein